MVNILSPSMSGHFFYSHSWVIFNWVENSCFSTLKPLILYLPISRDAIKPVVSESFFLWGSPAYFSLIMTVSECSVFCLRNLLYISLFSCVNFLSVIFSNIISFFKSSSSHLPIKNEDDLNLAFYVFILLMFLISLSFASGILRHFSSSTPKLTISNPPKLFFIF